MFHLRDVHWSRHNVWHPCIFLGDVFCRRTKARAVLSICFHHSSDIKHIRNIFHLYKKLFQYSQTINLTVFQLFCNRAIILENTAIQSFWLIKSKCSVIIFDSQQQRWDGKSMWTFEWKSFRRFVLALRESECFHHPAVSVLILSLIKSAFGICDQPQRPALHGDDYNWWEFDNNNLL